MAKHAECRMVRESMCTVCGRRGAVGNRSARCPQMICSRFVTTGHGLIGGVLPEETLVLAGHDHEQMHREMPDIGLFVTKFVGFMCIHV